MQDAHADVQTELKNMKKLIFSYFLLFPILQAHALRILHIFVCKMSLFIGIYFLVKFQVLMDSSALMSTDCAHEPVHFF